MSSDIGQKISVCLLTYNHVEVIASTMSSILEQTITGYEIIVSDDCSTDGTWELISDLAAKDARIRVIRTPHNMGMPGNANFAVEHSERPYIALLHHDDLYRKDLLEKWAGVLERHADATFVFNPYGVHESDRVSQVPIPGECVGGDWLLRKYLFPWWGCIVRGTAMIRREEWARVGGMRDRFGLLADVDMWMRLSMRGSVGYVAEPLITMRHQRPTYYPEIYATRSWSWRRQTFLYEIHASNRRDYLDLHTARGRIWWLGFRMKVSIETAKWLVYAVVKGRRGMIASSEESVTSYDLWPLRVFRILLQRAYPSSEGRPQGRPS